MRTVLSLDEINAFKKRVERHFDESGRIASSKDCEDIIDEMLDLYLLAYAEAVDAVNRQFGVRIEPGAQEIQEAVYKRIDGATWRDRVLAWYMAGGGIDEIVRIAETEAHRIANTAAYETAVKAGAKEKTWLTMLDNRVRDTHIYLESVTVPIDAEFYTYDGDHAQIPGGFQSPENNVGCRCGLKFG